MPIIGMFMSSAKDDAQTLIRKSAFFEGLDTLGVQTPTRHGADAFGTTPDFSSYDDKASWLSKQSPDLYFSTCWPTLQALQKVQDAKNMPPIVFAGIFDLTGDPVN